MNRVKLSIIMLLFLLAFAGCGQPEPEQPAVYSFRGENEQFAVSNGVIVLTDTQDIFYGGTLEVKQGDFSDISSYSASFYLLSGKETRTVLSNSVVDKTGSSVELPEELGKISGSGILTDYKEENLKNPDASLSFDLTVTDKKGQKTVYQLPMFLTEISGNDEP